MKYLISIFSLIINICTTNGQSSNIGVKFMTGFIECTSVPINPTIMLGSKEQNSVLLSVPGRGFKITESNNFFMRFKKDFNRDSTVSTGSSLNPIGRNIYMKSRFRLSNTNALFNNGNCDVSMVLPNHLLSHTYRLLAIGDPNAFLGRDKSVMMIIATEDSTELRITPSCDIENTSWKKGQTYTYRYLHRGQALHLKANIMTDDLTGTLIESVGSCPQKKIVVIGGHTSGAVSRANCMTGHDVGFHQNYPVDVWGKEYIAIPFREALAVGAYHVRVIAAENNTKVSIPGLDTLIFQAGQYKTWFDQYVARYISSDKPISVALYMANGVNGSQIRDCVRGDSAAPSMTILSPLSGWTNQVNIELGDSLLGYSPFGLPHSKYVVFYLNNRLLVTTSDTSSLLLNGRKLRSSFKPVPHKPGFFFAQEILGKATEANFVRSLRLTCSSPIQAQVYGYIWSGSYFYNAGLSFTGLPMTLRDAATGRVVPFGEPLCARKEYELEVQADTVLYKHFHWDLGDGRTMSGKKIRFSYPEPADFDVEVQAWKSATDCEGMVRGLRALDVQDAWYDVRGPGQSCLGLTQGYRYLGDKDSVVWSASGGTIVSRHGRDSVRVRWEQIGRGTLTLVVPSCTACRCDTSELSVSVRPWVKPPKPSGLDSLCSSSRERIAYTMPTLGGHSYRWQIAGGQIVQGQGSHSVRVDWDELAGKPLRGKIWVEEVIDGSKGCYYPSDTLEVVVRPQPRDSLRITLSDTLLCGGQTLTLGIEGDTLLTQADWLIVGPNLQLQRVQSRSQPLTFRLPLAGQYSVRLYATTRDICNRGIVRRIVLTVSTAQVAAKGSDWVCPQDLSTYHLLDKEQYQQAAWRVRGGEILAESKDSVLVRWTTSGAGSVKLAAINLKGCPTDTFTLAVTVKEQKAPPAISGAKQLCADRKQGFVYQAERADFHRYDWQIEGGQIKSGQNSRSITVDWFDKGQGSLWLERSSDSVCYEPSEKYGVTIHPALDSSMNLLAVSGVEDRPRVLSILWSAGEVNDASLPFHLLRDGLKIRDLPKSDGQWEEDGLSPDSRIYAYQLLAYNRCGDTALSAIHRNILLKTKHNEEEKTVSLSWNAYRPWPDAEYEIWLRLDGEATFTKIAGVSDTSYLYTEGLESFSHCFVVVARSGALASRSNASCEVFEHRIQVSPLMTPNGDGKNDVFYIDRLDRYPDNNLVVFNRWGQVVYRAAPYQNNWTAHDVSDGTYFYIFRFTRPDGSSQTEKGAFTVIRE
jgi:gliding motility-associated-like protein